MDIFKFNPQLATPMKMERGIIINGIKSKMWIERYRDAGEFTFVAPESSGIRKLLPIGTFISHTDTTEIMIVENHEISDSKDKESEVTITGRSFETILENRIVGNNKTFPVSAEVTDYIIGANYPINQAATLVYNHINVTPLLNDDYALPYVVTMTQAPATGEIVARAVKRGTVYSILLSLLEIENIGVKTIRPGPWSPLGLTNPNILIHFHKGIDRTAEIVRTYDLGEIERADYLWSNKNLKTGAYITGKWVETVTYSTTDIEHKRRMIYVDASDIDQDLTAAPTGINLTNINVAMQQRGREILASLNDIALTKAEVSKDAIKYTYRKDYDVGDLITISGDYNEISVMRVSEFVEIEDETGETGYPTLTME